MTKEPYPWACVTGSDFGRANRRSKERGNPAQAQLRELLAEKFLLIPARKVFTSSQSSDLVSVLEKPLTRIGYEYDDSENRAGGE